MTTMSVGFIAAAVFLAIFVGGVAVYLLWTRRPSRLQERLEAVRRGGIQSADGELAARGRALGEGLLVLDEGSFHGLRARLVHAGYPGRNSVFWFYTFRMVLAVGLLLTTYTLMRTIDLDGTLTVMFLFGAALGGYAIPAVWVNSRVSNRRDAIRAAIPNVLDLLIVCVEAGLSLNAAVQRIAKEMSGIYPELSRELSILNQEMFIGKSRAEAFRNLARRTGVDELRTLATVLMQSDRMGTSIAEVLRVQAHTIRTKRRQKALETAHKMPVKLVFPLVLCIFPAILVVLLGPGAIQIFRALSDMSG